MSAPIIDDLPEYTRRLIKQISALEARNRQLAVALSESLKLQRHYAELINTHDGGERRLFNGPAEWIARLIETGTLAATEPK